VNRLYVAFLFTDTQIKAFSKTLLQNTIDNMRAAVADKGPRVVFYSAHDSTIAILLAALNLTNVDCIYKKYVLKKHQEHCYW
jgi:hypothetical protein